jgi:hypothetical protein
MDAWEPVLVGVDTDVEVGDGGAVLELATNAVPLKLPMV